MMKMKVIIQCLLLMTLIAVASSCQKKECQPIAGVQLAINVLNDKIDFGSIPKSEYEIPFVLENKLTPSREKEDCRELLDCPKFQLRITLESNTGNGYKLIFDKTYLEAPLEASEKRSYSSLLNLTPGIKYRLIYQVDPNDLIEELEETTLHTYTLEIY